MAKRSTDAAAADSEPARKKRRRKKKGKKAPGSPRTVYVVEIMPKWHEMVAPELPPGKSCFYVGETGKDDPRKRFQEHLTGESLPGERTKKPVRPIGRLLEANEGRPLIEGEDLTLRIDLAERFNKQPWLGKDAAQRAERRAVISLRRGGHAVYPKKLGSEKIKFSSYKQAG